MIKVVRGAALAGLLAASTFCVGVIVPAFGASPAKPVISEEVGAAMQQMGQTLLGKQFSFQARTLRAYADTDGRFLHVGHTLKILIRRPDRLRVEINGDDGANQLFYDGKTLVLYGPAQNEYVSIPAPDTISSMLKVAVDRLGIDFPLADFLAEAPHKAILGGV